MKDSKCPFRRLTCTLRGGGEGMVWGAMLLWLQNLMIKGSKNQLLTWEHKPFFLKGILWAALLWLGLGQPLSSDFSVLRESQTFNLDTLQTVVVVLTLSMRKRSWDSKMRRCLRRKSPFFASTWDWSRFRRVRRWDRWDWKDLQNLKVSTKLQRPQSLKRRNCIGPWVLHVLEFLHVITPKEKLADERESKGQEGLCHKGEVFAHPGFQMNGKTSRNSRFFKAEEKFPSLRTDHTIGERTFCKTEEGMSQKNYKNVAFWSIKFC